jgi:hypothetical protein
MKELIKKLFFPVIGLLSLIWFLIRVIPKPSRAAYPCMRAAAPIASTFIVYLLGLTSSIFVFKKARKYLHESRYVLFSITFLLGIILGVSAYLKTDKKIYAAYQEKTLEGPNQPMGEGIGIFPGRVVWIYDPDATNENCPNTRTNYWSMDNNTDQSVVNKMVSDGLQMLTGEETDAASWDAIFKYYNRTHGRGEVGYSAGEKIVIKINLNGYANYWTYGERAVNTSPQVVYSVLEQLINVAGVAQEDIGVGDPGKDFETIFWDKCHGDFPNVEYWGTSAGRTRLYESSSLEIFASDGSVEDGMIDKYLEASYMINLPVFKKHHRAGISITSKNHFGTFVLTDGGAWNWHPSLPCPDGTADTSNGEYGVYRCFVDIMGHKDLGGKTILNLVDGLWSSINWGHPPIKWRMEPFNNDWPSSLFFSLDPVAIQSVCFDFLFYEFDRNHPTEGAFDPRDDHGPFPHYPAVDDFLHQAADSLNWPAGLIYDPENDGTPLPRSMGVHEHWNNAVEKKYSRNLGADKGIELISNYNATAVHEKNTDLFTTVNDFALYQNHPNPFNPTTNIEYKISTPSQVNLSIYNITGQKITTLLDEYQEAGHYLQRWNGRMDNGLPAPSGVYLYKIVTRNGEQSFVQTKKMILSK